MHGLRDSVLQPGMPVGEFDTGLERSGFPGSVAGRHRPVARHQQFPRVHRTAVPRPLRGGLRAGHQLRPGDHQAGGSGNNRQGVGDGVGGPPPPVGGHRPPGGGGRVGPGRAGRRPAVDAGRASGDCFRTGRPGGGFAALRDSRIQNGEAVFGPALAADGGGGNRISGERRGGRRPLRGAVAGRVRRGGAGRRGHAVAGPAHPRPGTAGDLPGDGVSARRQPGAVGGF